MDASSSARVILRRNAPRRNVRLAALGVLAVAVLPMVAFRIPGLAQNAAGESADKAAHGQGVQGVLDAIGGALQQLAPLQEQVEAGQIITNFGQKAAQILSQARNRAGPAAAGEVERAVDGALQALFLRQVSLLGRNVAAQFEETHGRQVPGQADQVFLTAAMDLMRPGSSWSFDKERSHLRALVEGGLRHRAALVEERARAARTQQATIDVIGKMQEQMERLAQKVQTARSGGSPWVLSTSYRIPNTPLQVVGRYEQGRANVELNLTPDKDPSKSGASFAEGIGPANVGVSFNLGL